MSPRLRIVDAVFARPRGTVVRRSLFALIAAAGVHASFGWWALHAHKKDATKDPEIEQLVELAPPPKPPVPPPAPPVAPPPKAPEPAAAPPPIAAHSPPQAPPPPAQAGQVIAQEPDPNDEADLGNTIVTGPAQTYAGGTTATNGTNTHAVDTRDVDPKASPTPHVSARPAPPAPDRSSPIALAAEDWTCPWPHEADDAEVDEQIALVRVTVRADGTPQAASILRDPGLGFGPAAVSCAMRARYVPAHDRDGHAVATISPPIRVRFIR